MKRFSVFLCVILFVTGAASTAIATTIVAGIEFDDCAFADVVLGTSGSPTFERIIGPTAFDRVATTAEDALLGSDLASSTIEISSGQSVTVGFTDNLIINESGADLYIFETFATPDGGSFQLEMGGTTLSYSASTPLGIFEVLPGVTNYVNLFAIELSDFGFALGSTSDYVRAWGPSVSGSEFAVFAAYNSAPVPEPMTILLLGSGLVGLAGLGRKKFFKKS